MWNSHVTIDLEKKQKTTTLKPPLKEVSCLTSKKMSRNLISNYAIIISYDMTILG